MATAAPDRLGTPEDPWTLTTPPGGSEFTAWRDPGADPPALVVVVGKTELRYRLEAIEDLHAMLDGARRLDRARQRRRAEARRRRHRRGLGALAENPVGGWYGLKKGLRGRFGNYVPPVLEALGLAEVEHNARNNRMRALYAPRAAGAAHAVPPPTSASASSPPTAAATADRRRQHAQRVGRHVRQHRRPLRPVRRRRRCWRSTPASSRRSRAARSPGRVAPT